MERWKSGKVEKWKSGKVEKWKSGKVECPFESPTVVGLGECANEKKD